MPRIPRYQQQVGPGQLPTPRVPGQMAPTGGEIAGPLVSAIGRAGAQIAQQEIQRAERAAIGRSLAEFQREVAVADREHSQLQGRDSVEAVDQYGVRIRQAQDRIAAQVPERHRDKFLERAEGLRLAYDQRVWGRADQNLAQQEQADHEAEVAAYSEAMADAPDVTTMMGLAEQLQGSIRERAEDLGVSEEQVEDIMRQQMTPHYAKAIQSLMRQERWDEAQGLTDNLGDVLTEEAQSQLQDQIQRGTMAARVRGATMTVYGDEDYFDMDRGVFEFDRAEQALEEMDLSPEEKERARSMLRERGTQLEREFGQKQSSHLEMAMMHLVETGEVPQEIYDHFLMLANPHTDSEGRSTRRHPEYLRALLGAQEQQRARSTGGRHRGARAEEPQLALTEILDELAANDGLLYRLASQVGADQALRELRNRLFERGLPADSVEKVMRVARDKVEPVPTPSGQYSRVDNAVEEAPGMGNDERVRSVQRIARAQMDRHYRNTGEAPTSEEVEGMVRRASRLFDEMPEEDDWQAMQEWERKAFGGRPSSNVDDLYNDLDAAVLGRPAERMDRARRAAPLHSGGEIAHAGGSKDFEAQAERARILEEAVSRGIVEPGLDREERAERVAQWMETANAERARLQAEIREAEATPEERPAPPPRPLVGGIGADLPPDSPLHGQSANLPEPPTAPLVPANRAAQLKRELQQLEESIAIAQVAETEAEEARMSLPVAEQDRDSVARSALIDGAYNLLHPATNASLPEVEAAVDTLLERLEISPTEAASGASPAGAVFDRRRAGRQMSFNTQELRALIEARRLREEGRRRQPTFPSALDATPFLGRSSRVTSPFGRRVHPEHGDERLHAGVDFWAPVGSPVLAPFPGTIDYIGEDPDGYGLYADVRLPDGYTVRYGHLSEVVAEMGQEVDAGALVARSGNSGVGTGPHLHVEIRDPQGRPIDPAHYMSHAAASQQDWEVPSG